MKTITIKTCADCGFSCFNNKGREYYGCSKMIGTYRSLYELRNYPEIPDYCPLEDAPETTKLADNPELLDKFIKLICSKKRQLDLLTSALEGGSNYWYLLPDLSMISEGDYEPKTPEVIDDCKTISDIHKATVNRIWEAVQAGKPVPVHDVEDEKEKLGEISIENIRRGILHMIEHHPINIGNIISDNHDANDADCFLQCVVMGEVIFG